MRITRTDAVTGISLVECNHGVHYQIRGRAGWIVNLYPTKGTVHDDQKHRCPIGEVPLPHGWTQEQAWELYISAASVLELEARYRDLPTPSACELSMSFFLETWINMESVPWWQFRKRRNYKSAMMAYADTVSGMLKNGKGWKQ